MKTELFMTICQMSMGKLINFMTALNQVVTEKFIVPFFAAQKRYRG